MSTIYLIRHGQTDWNASRRVMGRLDTPLNERGREQALSLSEAMRHLPIDAIFSSPQLRAQETAKTVVAARKLDVKFEPALAEVDFPRWVGKGWDEIQSDPVYQLYRNSPTTARHEGFEAISEVRKRTTALLRRVMRTSPEGKIAFVSHADPLRVLLSYMLKQPLRQFRCFRFSNASLTVLEGDSTRWILRLFNYRNGIDLSPDL